MVTRTLAAIIFGLFFASRAVAADPPSDTYAERLSAATRYAEVADFNKLVDDMVVQEAEQAPEKDRKKVLDFLRANVRTRNIERAVVSAMTKYFTADELNALADFYGSARGRSILSKFGPYMGEVMPVIQNELVWVIKREKDEKR